MRVWKIQVVESGDVYLYIDKTGHENKNKVKLVFWQLYFNDLFERPELNVTFVRSSDKIEVTGRQIVAIANRLIIIKLNG